MKNNMRTWVWIGIIIVVLLVLVGILSLYSGSSSPAAGPGVPSYAPQGELVSGFPPGLVLDSSAQIAGSYSVNYATTTNQYTASWTSGKSLTDLYALYKNYFQSGGWTISNEMTAYAGTKGLHAEKGSTSAGVSIVDNGNGRKISVTYVAQ